MSQISKFQLACNQAHIQFDERDGGMMYNYSCGNEDVIGMRIVIKKMPIGYLDSRDCVSNYYYVYVEQDVLGSAPYEFTFPFGVVVVRVDTVDDSTNTPVTTHVLEVLIKRVNNPPPETLFKYG